MAHLKSVLTFPPASAEERNAASLASHYTAVRHQTHALTAQLSAEDLMVQSCPEASPAKWHLAHTSWFFETFILSNHLAGYRPFHPRFRDLFNSYYNAVGQQPEKALRNTFSRPSLDEVRKYRAHVDEHMLKLLQSGTVASEARKLVVLGLNHEQQHQELIVTDIKHGFWSNPLHPAYQPGTAAASPDAPPQQRPQLYPEGLYEIGAEGESFYFDNEGSRHKVFLRPFRFAMRPATCGEYLAFMEDGGYSRPELWLSDGWKAVQTNRWRAPLYWEKSARRQLAAVHLLRSAPCRRVRTGLPRELLRSGRVCPLGWSAAAYRIRMGSGCRQRAGARQSAGSGKISSRSGADCCSG